MDNKLFKDTPLPNKTRTVEIFVIAGVLFIASLITGLSDIGPDVLPTLFNIVGIVFLATGWVRLFIYKRAINKELEAKRKVESRATTKRIFSATNKISNMNWTAIIFYIIASFISSIIFGHIFGLSLLICVLCGVGGMVSLVVLVIIDILLNKIFK